MWNKLKYRWLCAKYGIISSVKPIPFYPGNDWLILNYHGIVEAFPRKFNSRFLTTSMLERHLQFFTEHGNVAALHEVLDGAKPISGKLNVVLTFDDGYRNNYTNALPLLRKYNIPATFCITTPTKYPVLWPDLLDITAKLFPLETVELSNKIWQLGKEYAALKVYLHSSPESEIIRFYEAILPMFDEWKDQSMIKDYWELLSESELKQLSESPEITLVPHGVHHIPLGGQSEETCQSEIEGSTQLIDAITNQSNDMYCYPNGRCDERVYEIASSLGVKTHLLGDVPPELKGKPGVYERFVINPHISFNLQRYFFKRRRYI